MLVGRDRECGTVDELLAGAARSESAALVLRGEAGTGKSALLRYAAERAEGLATLAVTGVEAESTLDFAGLHGLLRPVLADLERVPEPQRRALGAALGLEPAGAADRFLISAGVLSLLAAAAERGPLVCLIDDAQWLDAASADALVFAARRLGAEGIVILFAAREGEVRRFDAPGLDARDIGPLDRQAGVRILATSAPNAVAHVRDRLLEESAGNALALLELPTALSEAQLAGRSPLPEALPLTLRLRTTYVDRVHRLPPDTRELLLLAAADDTGEPRVLTAAAAELNLGAEALDPAEHAGLLSTRDEVITFAHPLIRTAIYESATRAGRQRVHAALAGVLAAQGQADRSLWHRTMATDTSSEELAAALEAFARQSERRGGHASAASAFERAADLSEDARHRSGRLAAAAAAAWHAGQAGRGQELVHRALPSTDGDQRARLLHLGGVIEGRSGSLGRAVQTLQQAASLSDDPSLTLEILHHAATMAGYAGQYDAAIGFGLHAAELPTTSERDRYLAAAIGAYASSLSGDHPQGAAHAAEAVEIAERLNDPNCLLGAAITAGRHGITADGLAMVTRVVDVVRRQALVSLLPLALQAQARELVWTGRFDLSYSAAEEGWRLALDVGQTWAASMNLSYLVVLDAFRGEEASVEERTAALEGLVARSGARTVTNNIATARAVLELGLGRPGPALDHFLPMLAATRPESDPNFALGVPDAVEAAVRTDRVGEVTEHRERFERWVQAVPTPARSSLLARCRALLDEDGAEEHYAEAVRLAPSLSPFDRARTEQLYGEWLRRHRRRADARPHLRIALELFRDMSVAPWAARAQHELRASGETARRRDPSTRDQLTPQELQIARLVATGMTNPEIAAQLFLSPRTIDYHLRKVFVKLGISSRAELAGMSLGEPLAA